MMQCVSALLHSKAYGLLEATFNEIDLFLPIKGGGGVWKRAIYMKNPTIAHATGSNDKVMTSPAAIPRALRINQKLKLLYDNS